MQKVAPEDDFTNRAIKFLGAGRASSWPKAASDKACIFEAVQIVGIAQHGKTWDGSEFDALYWLESPKDEVARIRLESAAKFEKIRAQASTPFRSATRTQSNAPNALAGLFDFPREAHVIAWKLEQRQARWERNQRALVRLSGAIEWLSQRCRDGLLVSYARFRTGGHLWAMKAAEWNIDHPLQAFLQEGGHKRYFPELQNTGPFEVYLFFDREAVNEAVSALANAPLTVRDSDLSSLSPYLQLAVKVALARGYNAKRATDSAPVREAEVKAAWHEGMGTIPMSSPAINAITKVIGFPDPIAIEQGRTRKKK